jgi:hypothetical protein
VVEGFEDVGPALVADRQPTEAGEPGERAFDNPAVPTQPFAALDPAPRDAGNDAALATGAAATAVVVAFIGVQLSRASPRPAHCRIGGTASSSGSSMVLSCTFAGVSRKASGMPAASTRTWRLLPGLARSGSGR